MSKRAKCDVCGSLENHLYPFTYINSEKTKMLCEICLEEMSAYQHEMETAQEMFDPNDEYDDEEWDEAEYGSWDMW